MKKRYVKRLIRKLILFALTIVLLSLLTTVIVERRLRKEPGESPEVATDINGEPVTSPFKAKHKIVTPRVPRPPEARKNVPRNILLEDLKYKKPDNEVDEVEMDGEGPNFRLPEAVGEKKDWNDYELMEADRQRVGLGEHGQAAYITDGRLKEMEQNMSLQNGFNALLSDFISVNRSLPDSRLEGCQNKLYLAKLPTASVVIPFYNEHFSTLLRTLHSIVNRSPKELLKDIVIVDDCSDREELREQLEDYLEANFNDLVHVVRLPNRTGLIGARMAGARKANGDVLVFFDSHIECGYNWLPPLLEPIAVNSRIATCPIVEVISHSTFAFGGGYQEGYRGGFDWKMLYKQLPLLPDKKRDLTDPYASPVMMGGLFAISREFFFELGGYDEGLDIWGAEQYELSFKIWMCHGMMFDIPCSRVAHVFRGPMEGRSSPRDYNYVARNHKRVAEVWMDEYKQYVYDRDTVYENLDPGDLTAQKEVRDRLKCRSFRWFLTVVAPDLLERFPPVQPPPYAMGTLRSLAYPQFCLDSMNLGNNHPVGLYYCGQNKTHPWDNQNWELSHLRDIRRRNEEICLDVQDSHENATVWMWMCHGLGGNQFWYYDREQQWVVHGQKGSRCMEAIQDDNDSSKFHVVASACDASNKRMLWEFGKVNDELLELFYADLDQN